MASYDPSDVCFNPNVLNFGNKQILGDAIVYYPGMQSGLVLQTARTVGPGATGVFNKYHGRMHVDYFNVQVYAS